MGKSCTDTRMGAVSYTQIFAHTRRFYQVVLSNTVGNAKTAGLVTYAIKI